MGSKIQRSDLEEGEDLSPGPGAGVEGEAAGACDGMMMTSASN